MSDHRRRLRIQIGKVALARGNGVSVAGALEDISANGASVSFGASMKKGKTGFAKGEAVEIVVDKMTTLTGWVMRADSSGMAIEFAHDNESEKRLIAEIMESM
jgi:hypothetical protein